MSDCMNSSRVGKFDIEIVQGSETNDIEIVPKQDDGSPISLSGYTAEMQIRPTVDSDTILDTLTTDNDRIDISTFEKDGSTYYKVTIKFPADDTSDYDFKRGVYDLELIDSDGNQLSRRRNNI